MDQTRRQPFNRFQMLTLAVALACVTSACASTGSARSTATGTAGTTKSPGSADAAPATGSLEEQKAPPSNFKSVVAIASVADQPAAVAWYEKCLGRAVDLTPAPGVAEWELAPNAWIQVAADPDRAGKGTVTVVVHDLEAQRKTCATAGGALSDVQDYGVVKLIEATDPEGNKLVFVEEVAAPAS